MTGLAPPPNPGPAAWNEILPTPPPPMRLAGEISTDWLIIGAGFAGLAAARRLSLTRPGDRITVLEALRIGEGPAGRNSGFMIDLPHNIASENYSGAEASDRAAIAANRRAIAFALETAAAFGLPREAIAQIGKINAAASPRGLAHNTAFAKHLSRLGEDHEMYDAARMRAITGTEYYLGGLYTPHAVMLQPAMYIRGLANGLRSNRVTVAEESPVTALTRNGALWRAETPQGSVTAPKVILAVNGMIARFGHFRQHLAHVLTYASMTRPLTAEEVARLGGDPNWSATPADPLGTTVRRISGTGGDRIVVRNRFDYASDLETPDGWQAGAAAMHDAAFKRRFPMLEGVEMAYRWGGRLCLSRNDAPAFGEVDRGLYAACCQNGLGASRGTLSGIAAADLAAGENSPEAAFHAGLQAPSRLPPKPIARIGATAKIRWGEWRAGREC
ncbi:MAG: FAD-binding oxidoreductase [Pseudomonadota bacterium]